MAFGIYANMMFSFSDQLTYDREMRTALQRFVQFFTVYIPFFLKASIGVDSSINDMDMYHKLYRYRKIDAELADKSVAVMKRHGWYLVEQLIPFSLFSNKLENDTKSHLASRMLTITPPDKFTLGKPSFPEIKPGTKLVDLLGENSYLLFSILKVGFKWLEKDPKNWEEDSEFLK